MSGDPQSAPVDDTAGRQLLKHAEALAHLHRRLDDLTTETTETLANLLLRLQALEDHTPANDDRRGAGGGAAACWAWRYLGPHAAQTLHDELDDWVHWLRRRYPLARRIPACWDQHPEIVEELTALWLAWQAAYTEPDPPLTAAADWHDRWLPGLLHRLQHGPHALDCADTHRPRPESAYAEPPTLEMAVKGKTPNAL